MSEAANHNFDMLGISTLATECSHTAEAMARRAQIYPGSPLAR
ncbi:hypothetical protein SAMN03159444_03840 [Pseudomonas sp. NFACC02]|nr:hypothetical protein SAMN03159444_03840 [Pseudomonas sp. NFACC02]